ncbi:ADP-ribosylglycohydrolase family protein [Heyndrickxia coagulans]|uniref:ADP-ribosylglycohydrolase family protein n=1 Tax=Heyndrickxia coagulans TaxID=1398 RepID=UPI002E20EC28
MEQRSLCQNARIKERYGRVNEIVGDGCWNLKPGETTDDTEMTICVLKGIIASPQNPIEEIGKEFLRWWETDPKDIGITVQTAFNFYQGDWLQIAEKAHDELDGKSAGNGTLMRCLPVALAYSDLQKINEISALQSQMTHYDDLASEACVIYNRIASRLLNGEALNRPFRQKSSITGTHQMGAAVRLPAGWICRPHNGMGALLAVVFKLI